MISEDSKKKFLIKYLIFSPKYQLSLMTSIFSDVLTNKIISHTFMTCVVKLLTAILVELDLKKHIKTRYLFSKNKIY